MWVEIAIFSIGALDQLTQRLSEWGSLPIAAGESNDERTQSFVALTKDTKNSHYKVIKKIGKGGMGDVYLAPDTKLDRKEIIED